MRVRRSSSAPRLHVRAAAALCALLVAAPALADDFVVAGKSLKAKAKGSKSRLNLDFGDATFPFPPASGAGSPVQDGLTIEILTADNPTGTTFTAPPGNTANPGWKTKTGGKPKHSFKHRDAPDATSTLKTVTLRADGRFKVKGRSTDGVLVGTPGRVFVRMTVGAERACLLFAAADVSSLAAGSALSLKNASGNDDLGDCDDPVFDGCRDGDLDPGEQCDDGNPFAGDGCRADCTLEVCGDGLLDAGEDCDDGNTADGDECPAGCGLCGNHTVATTEACDPPFSIGGDRLCNDDCTTAVCGDGALTAGESCEDAPGLDVACPGSCGSGGALPCSCPDECGNGVVDGDEPCDPEAPAAEWTCPTNGFGQAASCGPVIGGAGCTCCDGDCGIGGIGCCTNGSCLPSPGGFGTCIGTQPCTADHSCSGDRLCDLDAGICCRPAGDPAFFCSALGVTIEHCCPPAECAASFGSGLGGCCKPVGSTCSGDPERPTECCSLNCGAGGLCECAAAGEGCLNDDSCCAGTCNPSTGTCEP